MPLPTPTFHRFSRLPIEIRLKIWALAMPGPRIVTIRIKSRDSVTIDATGATADSNSQPHGREELRSAPSAPALLHVCRESRRMFLGTKRYSSYFGDLQSYPVYFDHDMDKLEVICVGDGVDTWAYADFGGGENPLDRIMRQLSRVKRLQLWDGSPFFDRPASFGRCSNLETLTVIVDGATYYWLGENREDECDQQEDERDRHGPETLGSEEHIMWYQWFCREEIAGVELMLEEVMEEFPEWKVPRVQWRSDRVLELIAAGKMEDSQDEWML
ncbi:hypothetical protein BP6252_08922 [Coleophoma cylindrospora]|uniref:2EXR domain-containing protein n=1 Tax=Coleophoma cylindrospora TaxID=1849047 RepID=A0A3D8R0G4_9HELO|nr:hypothetical protein BP6252_08922 [Coleophoma cylindrospora]